MTDFEAIKSRQRDDVGRRRLRHDRLEHGVCRRGAVRGGRPSRRPARARRRLRHRQCRTLGGPAVLRCGRRRFRAGPDRSGARARGRRAAAGHLRGRRCRKPAVRGRELRRRALDLRQHVRARPGEGGGRAFARVSAGRQDRARQLDAGGHVGPAVQAARPVPAAAAGRPAAALVGDRGAHARAFRRRGARPAPAKAQGPVPRGIGAARGSTSSRLGSAR